MSEDRVIVFGDERVVAALNRISELLRWNISFEKKDENKIYEETIKGAQSIIIEDEPSHGISILRKIRIKELIKGKTHLSPVIFISFDERESLAKANAENCILFSKGCHFLRFPFEIEEICEALLKAEALLKTKVVNPEEVRPYLFLSKDQPEKLIRHRGVNYAGPYNLLIGAYLCGKIDQSRYSQIRNSLDENSKLPDEVEAYLAAKGYKEPEQPEGGDKKSECESNSSSTSPCQKKQGELQRITQGSKILLIDDESNIGWEKVLKAFFSNLQVIDRFSVGKAFEDRVEPWWDNVVEQQVYLKQGDWKKIQESDLILLDLRMDKKWDERIDPVREAEKLSGIVLLRKIRKELGPAVPVIIFTASNKAYNLEAAKRLGITGFFTKDEYRGEEEAKAHFLQFKQLIERAMSFERKNFIRIWKGISKIDDIQKRAEVDDDSKRKAEKAKKILKKAYFNLDTERIELSRFGLEYEDIWAADALTTLRTLAEMMKKERVCRKDKNGNVKFLLEEGKNVENWRKICFDTVYYFGSTAAHEQNPEIVNLHDAFFAFKLALSGLGIEVQLEIRNSAQKNDLLKKAQEMLKTLLKNLKNSPFGNLVDLDCISLAQLARMAAETRIVSIKNDSDSYTKCQLLYDYLTFIVLTQAYCPEKLTGDIVSLIGLRFKNVRGRVKNNNLIESPGFGDIKPEPGQSLSQNQEVIIFELAGVRDENLIGTNFR